MKLIVTGATGFVATEVIRQSLSNPTITSIIAISRKPVPVPSNLSSDSDTSKFRSIVIKDYSDYPEDVKKEFVGAGACIWSVVAGLVIDISIANDE
jgi:nucleoside-diphosphate-sugar epimerase